MWWGANETVVELPEEAVDYRNDRSDLLSARWVGEHGLRWSDSVDFMPGLHADGRPLAENMSAVTGAGAYTSDAQATIPGADPNDRGRGRTVETQAGGVAVLRCLWVLQNLE